MAYPREASVLARMTEYAALAAEAVERDDPQAAYKYAALFVASAGSLVGQAAEATAVNPDLAAAVARLGRATPARKLRPAVVTYGGSAWWRALAEVFKAAVPRPLT